MSHRSRIYENRFISSVAGAALGAAVALVGATVADETMRDNSHVVVESINNVKGDDAGARSNEIAVNDTHEIGMGIVVKEAEPPEADYAFNMGSSEEGGANTKAVATALFTPLGLYLGYKSMMLRHAIGRAAEYIREDYKNLTSS